MNCSALTPLLIESERFGHTKGSSIGATHTTDGLFQVSHRGTIFLDEIGELRIHLQAEFLRVMQERAIRPIGSTAQIPIDVRAIAATNRNLESAIQNGTFREDLYFRLNVVPINMPPLRQLRHLGDLERFAILRALREAEGNRLAAARLLGIGKTALYRKLKIYGENTSEVLDFDRQLAG